MIVTDDQGQLDAGSIKFTRMGRGLSAVTIHAIRTDLDNLAKLVQYSYRLNYCNNREQNNSACDIAVGKLCSQIATYNRDAKHLKLVPLFSRILSTKCKKPSPCDDSCFLRR